MKHRQLTSPNKLCRSLMLVKTKKLLIDKLAPYLLADFLIFTFYF
jgi:hypothetical protein